MDPNGEVSMEKQVYRRVWRNRYLTTESDKIDHMIFGLKRALQELEEMRKKGVKLDWGSDIYDDRAVLLTDDPKVAEEFDFN